MLWAAAFQIASMLKVRVVLLLPEDGSITVRAGYPPEDQLQEADLAAARWAFENNRPAGRGSDSLPGARRLFLPMRTGRGAIGVVGIDSDKEGQRSRRKAAVCSTRCRIRRPWRSSGCYLVEDVDKARLAAETDRLRTALLTSISHDLRTPLASILGAAGTLEGFFEAPR